jgi:predicted nucleic acid-binding protein
MRRVENARILFLDEMPVRRLLEFRSEFYPVMLRVLDIAYARGIQMVVSPATLEGVCHRAFEKNEPVLAREYKEFFTKSAQLVLRETDAEVAFFAAKFRAEHRLQAREALQLATAYVSGADVLLTENAAFRDALDLNVVLLSELV